MAGHGRDLTVHSAAEVFNFGANAWNYVGIRKTRQKDAHVWVDRREEYTSTVNIIDFWDARERKVTDCDFVLIS